MNTDKLLVSASVAFVLPGMALLFGGDELLHLAAITATPLILWLLEMYGGVLVGVGLLNWTQRHSLLGGIYGRPLLLCNLVVTSSAFFSSLRTWRAEGGGVLATVTIVSGLLLAGFVRRHFRTPATVGSSVD